MSNRSSTESPSLSFSPSLDSTESSKKRRRAPSDCTELPATRDGKPKVPRRIDPDRLAIRLGPELTSEMDAYIVPGAKMPSFEIRQGFVTKYNVDRRHIYDYFHSRGVYPLLIGQLMLKAARSASRQRRQTSQPFETDVSKTRSQ
ncbi:hypothetical protein DFH08DRAFT_843725 [Mycena albidolilacea]|uniref:Uncharacterized protein n=1 Tax=Mycena albidolilacea TaxID=1033008 RepID=A0AAD7AKN5_9AGAR|nr:hypothetical protein DFH08DRAFT_843725 [Mycena albidolilacea]